MTISTPGKAGVSLDALLAAKEDRAARQADWLTRYQQSVISLTLVSPGPIKDNIRYRNTLAIAVRACDQLLWRHRWPVLARQVLWLPTGPEALWCVAHSAVEIKAHSLALEQSFPLGRLWDFDLFCPHQGQITRHTLGLPPRRCLVCHDAAHCCARARRHPVADIVAQVEKIIENGFARD